MAKRGSKEHSKALIERTRATRIKKGEVRNPTGRPKKLPNLDRILAHVFGISEGQDDSKSPIADILMAMKKQATRGSIAAANLVLDRTSGKVKQTNVIINGGMSKEDVGNMFPFQVPGEKE